MQLCKYTAESLHFGKKVGLPLFCFAFFLRHAYVWSSLLEHSLKISLMMSLLEKEGGKKKTQVALLLFKDCWNLLTGINSRIQIHVCMCSVFVYWNFENIKRNSFWCFFNSKSEIYHILRRHLYFTCWRLRLLSRFIRDSPGRQGFQSQKQFN